VIQYEFDGARIRCRNGERIRIERLTSPVASTPTTRARSSSSPSTGARRYRLL